MAGADDLDLDRFNDSDSEPERGAPGETGGAGGGASRAADAATENARHEQRRSDEKKVSAATAAAAANGAPSGRVARKRAKKAAAKAARVERRKEERSRLPPRETSSAGIEDGDVRLDSDDDADAPGDGGGVIGINGNGNGVVAPMGVSHVIATTARSSGASERVHHGTLNVEGMVVGGKLVLVERRTGAVFSATRRGFDGSHLRIGTWDPAREKVVRLTAAEIGAQLSPPSGDGPAERGKGKGADTAVDASDDDDDPGGGQENAVEGRMEKPPSRVEHAFEVDADDHCETSPEAHANIVNFLKKAASAAGKAPEDLVIYDPYYCAGGTARSFAALGYPNVINRNEDFYAVVAENRVPAHDVLVTNPPYSADHVERCLTFAARNLAEWGRPYFLLLPSYVINKPYYVDALLTGGAAGRRAAEAREAEAAEGGREEAEDDEESLGRPGSEEDERSDEEAVAFKVHGGTTAATRGGKIPTARDGNESGRFVSRKQTLPFYVCPGRRYYYWTPKALIAARREASEAGKSHKLQRKKAHVGRLGERTSPFMSFWYCGMGDELQPEALRWHRKLPRADVTGYTVATHPNDLPLAVLDEWDPRRAAAVAEAREEGGGARKPKRYAGFSGANCGQNMAAKHKKKYREFDNKGKGGGKGDERADVKGGRTDARNWGNGKGGDRKEGSFFQRPRKKRKY